MLLLLFPFRNHHAGFNLGFAIITARLGSQKLCAIAIAAAVAAAAVFVCAAAAAVATWILLTAMGKKHANNHWMLSSNIVLKQ